MIIVTGHVVARDGAFAELRAECEAHCARSRTEDGCISHEVAVDCADPRRLVFLERWRDDPALRTHFAQAGTRMFMAAVQRLAEPDTGIDLYSAEPIAR